MEAQNSSKTNCGCGSDCCQPKKDSPWKKIVFIVVFLIAVTIIIIKLTDGNRSNASQVPCDPAKCGSSSCCDSNKTNTVTINKDTAACCPGSKK